MDDEQYKNQVEGKHRQRIERNAREAREKAMLAAAEKTAAAQLQQAAPQIDTQKIDYDYRREVAERVRRGEVEKAPDAVPESKARHEGRPDPRNKPEQLARRSAG